MAVSKESLVQSIQAAWSQETTSIPTEWNAESAPERGQCVPTSLVVQDYLGGQIERVATEYHGNRETHYRNFVDGEPIDLTRAQYPEDQTFNPAPVVATAEHATLRDYMLSYPATEARYHLLASRVTQLLELEGESSSSTPIAASL